MYIGNFVSEFFCAVEFHFPSFFIFFIYCWIPIISIRYCCRKRFNGHQYKGYIMISKKGEISRSISYAKLAQAPLCLAFGELNDWCAIIKDFQEVHIIKQSLQRWVSNILLIFKVKTSKSHLPNRHIFTIVIV